MFLFQALTVGLERDWLRTLAAIKNKDPKIYDPHITFYNEEGKYFNS
jgi:hypothetical protein